MYSVCFVCCVRHCDECGLCGVYSTIGRRFALVDVWWVVCIFVMCVFYI